MSEINLDATGAVIGRICTYAAKQALLGNTVNILNAEKAIMSGSMEYNYDRYHHLIKETGQTRKGPYIPRLSDRFVKRLVRGMLPYKRQRGAEAYKRIMCHLSVPTEFKDKKLIIYKPSIKENILAIKHVTVQELCKKLGGRV